RSAHLSRKESVTLIAWNEFAPSATRSSLRMPRPTGAQPAAARSWSGPSPPCSPRQECQPLRSIIAALFCLAATLSAASLRRSELIRCFRLELPEYPYRPAHGNQQRRNQRAG